MLINFFCNYSRVSKDSDKAINYVQLQDLTIKWMADFEDLQKMLMNQTAEMINRDIILSSNEDKVISPDSTITKIVYFAPFSVIYFRRLKNW